MPGVYRMLDGEDNVIYVGKARDLRRRVSSYFFRSAGHSPKVSAMLKVVCRFEVTTTANESEALILESNLIKDLVLDTISFFVTTKVIHISMRRLVSRTRD